MYQTGHTCDRNYYICSNFSNILLSKLHYFVIVLRSIGEKARINNIKVRCM